MSGKPPIDKLMAAKLECERLREGISDKEIAAEERDARRELSNQIYAHGCVCPPGAERTCQGPLCPRQKWIVT